MVGKPQVETDLKGFHVCVPSWVGFGRKLVGAVLPAVRCGKNISNQIKMASRLRALVSWKDAMYASSCSLC